MEIKVVAFGVFREVMESKYVTIDIDENLTIGDLKELISIKYPETKNLNTYMIAMNEEYATDDQIITGNAEIALIPPVSGG